jgi:hypothetical protein
MLLFRRSLSNFMGAEVDSNPTYKALLLEARQLQHLPGN